MENSPAREVAPKDVLDAIAAEYETTISLPTEKPAHQWILLPVGLIGAGKTTVVKPLAKRLHLVRLCTDDVRRVLKEQGYRYEGAREIIQMLLRKYLSLGWSLALDANTGSKIGLEYNARTEKEFPRVRQLYVHIDPPEEYIVQKLKNYHHTWLFKDAENAVENYYTNKADFALPDLPFVYTFDPSRDDLPKQIEEGARALRSIVHSKNHRLKIRTIFEPLDTDVLTKISSKCGDGSTFGFK